MGEYPIILQGVQQKPGFTTMSSSEGVAIQMFRGRITGNSQAKSLPGEAIHGVFQPYSVRPRLKIFGF